MDDITATEAADIAFALPPEKKRDTYGTPDWLFDPLHEEFRFQIDAAASRENHKCDHYFCRENSAFGNAWDEPTFVNPPFSIAGGGLKYWARCAYDMAQSYSVPVVMIAPGDISAGHRKFALQYASEVRDLSHRVNFIGGDGRPKHTTAIYVFRPVKHRVIGAAHVSVWDYRPKKDQE